MKPKNALVEHLYTSKPNRSYVIEGVHWIIEMKDPDETWFCVTWEHEVIQLSWVQITGKDENGKDVYSFAEQQKWLHRSDVLELREKGHVWIEQKDAADHGQYPPFFLVYDEEKKETVVDFPISLEDGDIEEMRNSAALIKATARATEKLHNDDDAMLYDDEDAVSFVETALKERDGDRSPAESEEDERVRAEDVERFRVMSAEVVQSARVIAEEKRVQDAATAEFVATTKETALKESFSCHVQSRMQGALGSAFANWRFAVTLTLEGDASAFVRSTAQCICGSCISLLNREGASLRFNLTADGIAVFDPEAVIRFLRIGNVTKHASNCSVSARLPGTEPEVKRSRASRSTQLGVLSAAEIRDFIVKQYGVFLFRRNSVAYANAEYRLRHISAAEQLVGAVMVRLPSFVKLLKVCSMRNGQSQRMYFDASGDAANAVKQLRLFISAAQQSIEVVGGGELTGFKRASKSKASKGQMASAGTIACHRLFLTRFLAFLCTGGPDGEVHGDIAVVLKETEQEQRKLNNASVKLEKYLRAVQQTKELQLMFELAKVMKESAQACALVAGRILVAYLDAADKAAFEDALFSNESVRKFLHGAAVVWMYVAFSGQRAQVLTNLVFFNAGVQWSNLLASKFVSGIDFEATGLCCLHIFQDKVGRVSLPVKLKASNHATCIFLLLRRTSLWLLGKYKEMVHKSFVPDRFRDQMFPAFLTVYKKNDSMLRPVTSEEIFGAFEWVLSNDVTRSIVCNNLSLFELRFQETVGLFPVKQLAESLQKMRRIWTVITVLACGGDAKAMDEVALMTRHSLTTIMSYYDMFAHQRMTMRASMCRGSMFGLSDADYCMSELEMLVAPMVEKLRTPMLPMEEDVVFAIKLLAADANQALSIDNPQRFLQH